LPKGDATVSYEDPNGAKGAVDWFNGKPFEGKGDKNMEVSIAQRKANPLYAGGGGGGGGGGGYGGRGGGGYGGGGRGGGGGYGGGRGGGGGYGGDRGGGGYGRLYSTPSLVPAAQIFHGSKTQVYLLTAMRRDDRGGGGGYGRDDRGGGGYGRDDRGGGGRGESNARVLGTREEYQLPSKCMRFRLWWSALAGYSASRGAVAQDT
jgi:RNA-binding protein FUS